MNLVKSVVFVAAAGVLGACATTASLAPTTANPGSEGEVRVSAGPNGNSKVEVKLDHLPDPRALDPTYATYVVWIKAEDATRFVNVGQVAINSQREGRLDTVTPHRSFTVVVTAEPDATASEPGTAVVLRGDVERPRGFMRN